jgi:hypothetical protein
MSTPNGICVPGTDIPNNFATYMDKCRSNEIKDVSSNFFEQSTKTIQDQFTTLEAQCSDLITTGNSVDTLLHLTENSGSEIKKRIDSLGKQNKDILHSIDEKRRIADSADKSFIEDIMHKTPHKELLPSIQDGVLFLFWFGWLTMMITLVVIRWFSPGGTWKAGLFTLLLLSILTLCVYGLLLRIA